MNKSELRKIYQQKRRQLSAAEVKQKSQLIADNFFKNFQSKFFNFKNKKLAFYIAANNEVDPQYLIKDLSADNTILLPRILADSKKLIFKKYQIGDKLEKNSTYNIYEPSAEKEEILPDVVFVPLVAFDESLSRIGMGGGFYDATIRFFQESNMKIIFIGLAFDMQQYQSIPADDRDRKLNFIISEENIFL